MKGGDLQRVFVQDKKKALNHKTTATVRAKRLKRKREKQQTRRGARRNNSTDGNKECADATGQREQNPLPP